MQNAGIHRNSGYEAFEVGYFIGGYAGSGFASVPLSICGGIAVEYLGGGFGSLMGGLIYDALY